MKLPIGIALAVVGIILLVMGISASDSLGSEISEFFTGNPTDKAVWMIVGGAGALVAGAVMAGLSRGKTA